MITTNETDQPGVTAFELPSDTEIQIRRTVAAPRALVFDCYTKPEHLPHWMTGPPGWTMPVCEIDLRPGGAYRYVLRGEGDAEMTLTGVFQEVERPLRIVATESWGPGWPETVNTVSFAAFGSHTSVTTLVRYPSQEARDAALRSGMREGLEAGFASLEAYAEGVDLPPVPEMRLELVPVPVADVDRAVAFYVDLLGFGLDHDIQPGNGSRVTQLTPPGSACSIVLYKDLPGLDLPVGTLRGLHLVVADIHRSRELLLARGVALGGVDDLGGILYCAFADPDGNTWLLQQVTRG
ncbi:SRPBCC domain-containing protein [Dactylosporangium sp. NPDC005555]|uniref:SRPBCC domain-containing protein n=1 Tax=Dactylosporangium sp. NPDC005555 TaxID=3154889 RepID=UPI0033AB537B